MLAKLDKPLAFRSGNIPPASADDTCMFKFANLAVATANAMENFNGMLA